MEITEQQFNANLQNLSEMDQQNVVGIIQEIDGDELRSFAKALGVNIVMSEEVAEEPMDATVDPAMDEMPMEEPPMEAPPAEVPPVEAPPAPVQPSMDQQMQQLALGDQVVEPVPEEAMPTEAMPTEAVPMEAAPVDAVAGPIMQDGASETGVADDVPMDAEEGAYVVNAAAIERVGVRDFEERILKPNIESLRKKGVEISLEQLKSPAAQVEGDTDVAVSNGEYYLPPVLVAEIGLDLLEKINKRGEQETEERIAEEEAPVDPMQQQVQALKNGDRVKKNFDPREQAKKKLRIRENDPLEKKIDKISIAKKLFDKENFLTVGFGHRIVPKKSVKVFEKLFNINLQQATNIAKGKQSITRDQAIKLFNNDYTIKEKDVIKRVGGEKIYKNIPKKIQEVLIDANFRGDFQRGGKKYKWVNHALDGNYDKAAIEVTKHEEFRKNPNSGVSKRLKDYRNILKDTSNIRVAPLPPEKPKPAVNAPLPPEKPISQSTLMQIPLSDTSKIEEIPFKKNLGQ